MNKTKIFYKTLIGLFVVSFIAFIYLMNVGIEERHEMKDEIIHLGGMIDSSSTINQKLTKLVNILSLKNDSLETEIKHLKSGTKNTTKPPKRMGLYKYKVRTYSNSPNTQVIKEIDVYLYGEGYNILLGKNYNTMPNWLSKHPTVYYHSEKTKALAHKIALDIEDITNIKFKVKKGSGDEVKPGEEQRTIFIHYSKPQ